MNAADEGRGGDMAQETTAIDPVCGMSVATAMAEYRSSNNGRAYYFCSSKCKETFDKDPEKYAAAGNKGSHVGH